MFMHCLSHVLSSEIRIYLKIKTEIQLWPSESGFTTDLNLFFDIMFPKLTCDSLTYLETNLISNVQSTTT